MMELAQPTHIGTLIADARAMVVHGERRILGLAGSPGAGKSTLSAASEEALGKEAAVVGLDSFHLSNAALHDLGRHDRKGAADTFDAAGYLNLLRRLRDRSDAVVYAGQFDRKLEETIACRLAIGREVPLVITEGNYLLVDDSDWGPVRALLDECWFIDPGESTRIERLTTRHERFGRSPEEARKRSLGSDQHNAELIRASRDRADRVVRLSAESEIDERLWKLSGEGT